MKKINLDINNQIEYMKNVNGIKFNLATEEEAKDFLKHSNYFFKLKSFAKTKQFT